MRTNPHLTTEEFEHALGVYTGAPHAVAVNSCTMALLLSCAWARHKLGRAQMFSIPKRTYVGVPMSIHNARCGLAFHDEEWKGEYELKQLPKSDFTIWDAARRFRREMFNCVNVYRHVESDEGPRAEAIGVTTMRKHGTRFQCVSFHVSKILGHSQGGAILHNDPDADKWLRRARFDGRTEGVPPAQDVFDMVGWHCYLSPDVAAALLWKLSVLPDYNEDLPNSDYPDLSLAPIFGGVA